MGDEQGDKELKALCKLFIGGIPRSISDEQLAEAFLQFTNDESLADCVVIKDAHTKESRGFGFVTYNKLCDTDNCLANRPHMLGGKEVEVKHAIPRDEQNPTNHTRTNKIFVGGLSTEVEEDHEVRDVIQNHTLTCGEGLNVVIDKVDIIKKEGTPRGFCFLEMASEDDADKVVIVKYFTIKGKRVELKKAEPKGPKAGGGMPGRGGGRGGRGSNRGGGGGGGRMSSFGGGGGGWGGGEYEQQYGGLSAAGYGFGSYGGAAYPAYGGAITGFGGGYDDYSLGTYPGQSSSYGPSRVSNGRYGGGGRGRGGGRPY